MSNFKVGDQVIIMPNGDRGYVKTIDLSSTYPILVYYSTPPSSYEGSYTLNGFRFTDRSTECQKYYIIKDVVASAQTTQPATKTSPYWSIVRVNSVFIHLAHTGQGNHIIPISSLTSTHEGHGSVILSTDAGNYELGPIPFDEVANLLFAKQQSNSI